MRALVIQHDHVSPPGPVRDQLERRLYDVDEHQVVPADSFDAEVGDLRAKGISFQTFDAEGLTWDDGVASMGEGFRSVWFSDPDGNTLMLHRRYAPHED